MSGGILTTGFVGLEYSVEKMYPFAKGAFVGAQMKSSLRALTYMREHHGGQLRKDGQPYEIHPLMMVNYALSFLSPVNPNNDPVITDDLCATILLHDVPEECHMKAEDLPFNDVIKTGVKYMTLTKFAYETKYDHKRRYMWELLESREAAICKAIDRYFNLSTMPYTFEPDGVRKNVVETDLLLMPVLKAAERKWANDTGLFHILRTNVQNINDILAYLYGVRLTDPKYHNPENAKDYSYLVTGAEAH